MLEVSMDKIELQIFVRADNWTDEIAIIASNVSGSTSVFYANEMMWRHVTLLPSNEPGCAYPQIGDANFKYTIEYFLNGAELILNLFEFFRKSSTVIDPHAWDFNDPYIVMLYWFELNPLSFFKSKNQKRMSI